MIPPFPVVQHGAGGGVGSLGKTEDGTNERARYGA